MEKVYQNILRKTAFDVPHDWLRIRTIDMHTGGEPLRVILGGLPELEGNSVLEYRRYMKENLDQLRTSLMFEPRGHADMYGCILLPPNNDSADFGILFIHNEGYSTMCGHAIIAISRLAVDMCWIKKTHPQTKLEIDAPCGRITSWVNLNEQEKYLSTEFHCVPSFVVGLDYEVEVKGTGKVKYDLAYGGAFYAYVDADALGLELSEDNYRALIEKGMDIKHAVMNTNDKILHPFEDDLSFLYGTIFISKKAQNGGDDRNVCIFADGEVDRSPTGSGVSGRMAIHAARQEMKVGSQPRVIESILGTKFEASIDKEVDFGHFKAVIPKVKGTAHIVGQNEWLIDPEDDLKSGFILR